LKKTVKNLPIANPNFLKNFKKQVTQLSQKTKFVEEFESEDEETNLQEKISFANKNKKCEESQQPSKLFGSIKFPFDKLSKIKNFKEKTRPLNPASLPLVEEAVTLDIKNQHQRSFN
jgi:hypothetical protein